MNAFHRWYRNSRRWRRCVQEDVVPWVLRDIELGPNVLELGPGPGLTTDVLAQRVRHLTTIELDPRSADRLEQRFRGTNVEVIEGDATDLTFDNGVFSGALCFTMLHHVPSIDLQDRLLSEVHRVLAPGALFVGSDSTPSVTFRTAHLFDTMVLVDPDHFKARLDMPASKTS